MSIAEPVVIIFIAFILDLLIGDPPYRFHPIRVLGLCITRLEKGLKRLGWGGKGGGIALVLLMLGIVLSCYVILSALFFKLHPVLGYLFTLYLCYSCLAMGDLLNHIKPVIHSLETGDLDLTRKSMALIVGREVQGLDEQALGRAAVETLAENFIDGFLSPLFWYCIGGILSFFLNSPTISTALSLMLVFKIASTLDSMVGYKNRRYVHFGWAGAKLDDLMNFIPARISIFFLFFGAWMTGLKPVKGVKIALRDRLKHDSPNAAHAESFVAGALDIRLGGPTKYAEGLKDKPWLGDGTSNVGIPDIRQTAVLLRCSAWISIIPLFPLLFVSIAG